MVLTNLEVVLGSGAITTAALLAGVFIKGMFTDAQCEKCGIGDLKAEIIYLCDLVSIMAEGKIPQEKQIELRQQARLKRNNSLTHHVSP